MEAVIFIGIPASGKTTFYRQRFFETHVRISLDMLKTRHREKLLLEACIRALQPFVVDNTNVLRDERTLYIRPARAAGFQVCGYFFEPQAGQAIAWNRQRTGKAAIPVAGLLGKLKHLERPHPDEGFDRLYRVQVHHAAEFKVEKWGPSA
ncbi:MAG: ATP-binding protein [Desulfobacteraceae bacterium]|nr:MAG: ATP-binding protein [Desulfobacteraceae bacterium]